MKEKESFPRCERAPDRLKEKEGRENQKRGSGTTARKARFQRGREGTCKRSAEAKFLLVDTTMGERRSPGIKGEPNIESNGPGTRSTTPRLAKRVENTGRSRVLLPEYGNRGLQGAESVEKTGEKKGRKPGSPGLEGRGTPEVGVSEGEVDTWSNPASLVGKDLRENPKRKGGCSGKKENGAPRPIWVKRRKNQDLKGEHYLDLTRTGTWWISSKGYNEAR